METSLFNKKHIYFSYKVMLSFLGILLVGVGISLNAMAGLGNDPVTIFYDGIKNMAGLSAEQLGVATNIVNWGLLVIVFFLDKHYVNIGTFIYILPLGTIIDSATKIIESLHISHTMLARSFMAALGCMILAMGLGLFIAIDMGVDSFTGIVLILRDKTKKPYKMVKICFDFTCVLLGILLGGKFGVVTLLTAIFTGILISYFSGAAKKLFLKEKDEEEKVELVME